MGELSIRNRTYKAKPKDSDEYDSWIFGYIWTGADHTYLIPSNLGIGYDNRQLRAYAIEVYPDTVSECLSTTSREFKTLYENDIINIPHNDTLYVIKWIEYRFAAYIIADGHITDAYVDLPDLIGFGPFAFSIKGNIFDNKDLITKEK